MKFLKVMGLLAGFTFMFTGFNNASACDTKCETKKASNSKTDTKTEVKSKTDKAKVDNQKSKTATTAAKTEANK